MKTKTNPRKTGLIFKDTQYILKKEFKYRYIYTTPSNSTRGFEEVLYGRGYKLWWMNRFIHRSSGPAVELADGGKEWWINGELHREGRPATEYPNGKKTWWIHGERHREDGPAVKYGDGSQEWWINNIEYTENEFKQWLEKRNLNEKLQSALVKKTEEKRVRFKAKL